ncbi:MAG: hypothetical protein JWR09_962 [Mucilaginibacter sp.]|nr:hypothetical protein [Mucilaginibacter sp.]
MRQQRQIITIATGKKLYLDLAVNLARSFLLWHKGSDIVFQLVTDLPDLIPGNIKPDISVIGIETGEIGRGFSTKLHLDKLVSDGQTLFIDSDCLVYQNLDFVFRRFSGKAVSVVGNYISKGEWFGDVRQVCRYFGIKHMPKFNGGVYYLEKGDTASAVYQTAREIEKNYDKIGFVRLRNRPNDEVILSVAMELHRQEPVPEDGSIMAEFVNFRSGVKSDLLRGVAELYNSPGHKHYQPGWPLSIAHPAIVHFLGDHNQKLPYLKEAMLLNYLYAGNGSELTARVKTYLGITIPYRIKLSLKNILRPFYHSLFGVRAIKKSERIID